MEKYFFEIEVEGSNNGTDTDDDDEDGTADQKSSQTAVLIVVIGAITTAMLCAIFYIVHKKGQVHNETSPLATLETTRRN